MPEIGEVLATYRGGGANEYEEMEHGAWRNSSYINFFEWRLSGNGNGYWNHFGEVRANRAAQILRALTRYAVENGLPEGVTPDNVPAAQAEFVSVDPEPDIGFDDDEPCTCPDCVGADF